MKFKLFIFSALLLGSTAASAQQGKHKLQANMNVRVAAHADTLARPRLVVGIIVDQMRWDYLFRFSNRYGNLGFKRLLAEGFSCDNTMIDYLPTVTAAGHSCVYTGSVPAIHGIAGNDFVDQATGKLTYCTGDSTVRTVGSTSDAGEMSPRNLLTTTVTDELRLATNFRSKVIGIALKDRGGILPAGHTANAAYWFDDKSGNWITSTYYMNELPGWLKDFNAKKLPQAYLGQDWNTLYPIASYGQSEPDNSKYEGKFKGTESPTLPVRTSVLYKGNAGLIRSVPAGNTFTLDMATAAVNGEQLGMHSDPDFLAVSLSTPDYIGHQFGPNSVEIEDNYLRLDRDLGAFFAFLDRKVGKGKYTVFLTADHGAAHNPAFLKDHGVPAGVWNDRAVQEKLNHLLEDKYKVAKLVLGFNNYQVNFDYKAIHDSGLSEAGLKRDCIDFLEKQPGVAFAIDLENARIAAIPESLRTQVINGYSREHSGAIQIILLPGWYSGQSTDAPTGTTHGTWNPYDTHIPLVFMGWGIKTGHLNRETHMTDIAATVAALLHIQMPNGCIGAPISEVLR